MTQPKSAADRWLRPIHTWLCRVDEQAQAGRGRGERRSRGSRAWTASRLRACSALPPRNDKQKENLNQTRQSRRV